MSTDVIAIMIVPPMVIQSWEMPHPSKYYKSKRHSDVKNPNKYSRGKKWLDRYLQPRGYVQNPLNYYTYLWYTDLEIYI